jgi:hypothetical protein
MPRNMSFSLTTDQIRDDSDFLSDQINSLKIIEISAK